MSVLSGGEEDSELSDKMYGWKQHEKINKVKMLSNKIKIAS